MASVNTAELGSALRGASLLWVALSLFMFIPQTMAIAYRWTLIARPLARIPLQEAVRQVLASSCLNLVLPSKLGDLAKGVFLFRQGKCGWEEGIQIVVFEKLLDLAALSALMLLASCVIWPEVLLLQGVLLIGLGVVTAVALIYFSPLGAKLIRALLPNRKGKGILSKVIGLVEAGPKVMELIRGSGGRKTALVLWSLGIWMLHLIQIVMFFFAIGVPVTVMEILLKMPMAMFVGLLPISLAGFGTREWAIVLLFQSQTVTAAMLVAVAVLFSSRYLIPAAFGLLFFQRYYGLSKIKAPTKPHEKRRRKLRS